MSRDTTDGRAGGGAQLPPDDDIAALFDAQAHELVVPADLDARVRDAARAAVTDDGPGTVPAPDASAGQARRDTLRYRHPPRWLAAAAVVALAVALLPLVRQAPESRHAPVADDAASPSPLDATIAEDTAVPDAATGVAAETTERRVERAAATGDAPDLVPSEMTPPTARRKATMESAPPPTPLLLPNGAGAGDDVPFDPIVDDIDAEHRRQLDAVEVESREEAEADTTPAADPFDGYRRTPALWLDRLRERLRADGLTPRLEAEYRRFRSRHPDVEPAFDPEAVAREGEAARR